MEKKNIGMKVTIVILSILVISLAGYIVYDKVLSNKDTDITDENTNTNDNNIANDEKENNIEDENNQNDSEEDELYGLEKLTNSFWWKKGTDKFLYFGDSDFVIYREGKGCGPEDGCGNGEIDSIVKVKENIYDIKFTWSDGYESINYLATIDISNIDNDEITLVGFYTVKGNNKTKLIDSSEKYICSGKEYDETIKNFYGM